jgi:hypothetical protein
VATTRKQQLRERLAEYVRRRPPRPVDRNEWEDLREKLSPVPERILRALLRETGVPMEPLVAGVDQSSFASLEASLMALLEAYREGEQATCRRLIIRAKEHARWASRRAKDESRRVEKEEMAEWMRIWLENPAIFPAWVRVRRQVSGSRSSRA